MRIADNSALWRGKREKLVVGIISDKTKRPVGTVYRSTRFTHASTNISWLLAIRRVEAHLDKQEREMNGLGRGTQGPRP